jgi:thiamine pyrophosphate-dependent acetolactate synthase large subunit-like protein
MTSSPCTVDISTQSSKPASITRHEQAAAHMADGWARTTGRPGVAMVTAGPGVTDAVTGVANAYLDAIPMVLIGGRSPLLDDETLPLQGGIDQVALMRPITKWARSVTHTERIAEYVAMAFRQAVSGRPGPVFLKLPIDVLFARRNCGVDRQRFQGPSARQFSQSGYLGCLGIGLPFALAAKAAHPQRQVVCVNRRRLGRAELRRV